MTPQRQQTIRLVCSCVICLTSAVLMALSEGGAQAFWAGVCLYNGAQAAWIACFEVWR